MPTYSEVITKRIRELCNEQNITISKLSELAGLNDSSISSILYGYSTSPNVGTLHRIAAGLGMDVVDFLDFPEMRNIRFDANTKVRNSKTK